MPAQPSFIPLSDAELAELFGDDSDGLRRYRLLYAVLVEGKTQHDAAAAGGVSERTVRNILRAYAQGGGLGALRSRQGLPRRRERRPAAFERALADALADEPSAGGDTLWRRAQERLGEDGAKLSRRTAYRILTELRSDHDDDDAPDSLRGAVKAALPLLSEDPPLTLGSSALAQRFLPADLDPLPRGTLIQQTLRAALDLLRPAGPVSTIDRSWWPYLICTGEYEAGQTRAELQESLALSPSTYSRAKRQGLDRITAALPQIIERMLESPATLASQQIPRTPDFIGRRDEQSYYAWRLQAEGLAHIWGLPGSGKTALAAELAADGHRYGQTILWHTCRPGRDATLLGIVRGLARALAATGDDLLWRELRQATPDDRDATVPLETLRDRLMARPAVVVLDNIHYADAHETAALLDALADLVVRRSSRLLLVGRDPIEGVEYPPLHGLSEREAERLWAGALPLAFDQWRALFATTGGMPEPIRRAAAAYRRSGELARPADWVGEVEAWASEAIWSRLDDDARQLVAAAHALEGQAWGSQAELVCDTLGLPAKTFRALLQRGLLCAEGDCVALFGALRTEAAARLRAEDDLRAAVEALTAGLEAAPTPAAPAAEEQKAVGEPTPAPQPSGLELIERVRSALEDSAEFLREQGGDQARQLARELSALQDALPNLAGPRLPFARPIAAAP
jgi:transposase